MALLPSSSNTHLAKTVLLILLSLSLALVTTAAGSEELPKSDESNESPDLFINLLDKSHAFILNRVNAPAIWFDLFFGDLRTEDEELPSTFVRLRTSARFIEGEGLKFPVRLRASLKLPRASRKLRLIVTGESEDDIRAGTEETTTIATGEEEGTEQSSVGLRYNFYHTLRSNFHFGAGVSDLRPFDYYFRVSFRRFLHLCDKDLVRFSQTGFWNSINNFGETSRLDLERKMSSITTGRISLYGTYVETGTGVEWGVESSLFRRLSPKTALSLELGAYGETRPHTEISNARIAQRLRRNILRPWLFSEVETEVTFPLTEDDGRKAVGALSIIFEIQFSSL